MKNASRTLSKGATLLEIMLVLAIAAMVIVMSVRYYTTSTASRQAASALAQVAAIQNAASTIAGESADYSTVNNSSIIGLMPPGGMETAWGKAISVSSTGRNSYQLNISEAPAAVCAQIKARLSSDEHYDLSNVTCPETGSTTMLVTYNAVL